MAPNGPSLEEQRYISTPSQLSKNIITNASFRCNATTYVQYIVSIFVLINSLFWINYIKKEKQNILYVCTGTLCPLTKLPIYAILKYLISLSQRDFFSVLACSVFILGHFRSYKINFHIYVRFFPSWRIWLFRTKKLETDIPRVEPDDEGKCFFKRSHLVDYFVWQTIQILRRFCLCYDIAYTQV